MWERAGPLRPLDMDTFRTAELLVLLGLRSHTGEANEASAELALLCASGRTLCVEQFAFRKAIARASGLQGARSSAGLELLLRDGDCCQRWDCVPEMPSYLTQTNFAGPPFRFRIARLPDVRFRAIGASRMCCPTPSRIAHVLTAFTFFRKRSPNPLLSSVGGTGTEFAALTIPINHKWSLKSPTIERTVQ
jgi:hypothetical protein